MKQHITRKQWVEMPQTTRTTLLAWREYYLGPQGPSGAIWTIGEMLMYLSQIEQFRAMMLIHEGTTWQCIINGQLLGKEAELCDLCWKLMCRFAKP